MANPDLRELLVNDPEGDHSQMLRSRRDVSVATTPARTTVISSSSSFPNGAYSGSISASGGQELVRVEAIDETFKELLQTLRQFDTAQKPKKRTKLNITPGKSFEGTDMGNYVWLTLNQDLQEFKAVIQVIQLQENQHLKQYFRQMQALAQQQSYAQRFGGFGPGFFQGPEDFGGSSDPNVNEGFIRTPGNDENVGAFATANITPQGGHGTVGVLPGLATRFSSDDGGSPPPNGNSFGVFTSSSSGSSDVNGKKTSYKTATSAINDNGKITVYNASSQITQHSLHTSYLSTKDEK
uniref:Uncharacterized protein n=1 Tax=Timema douglasi TaxID=61478 RepID=A0A7R8Z857_TIMDO|nr:unnamed protein product [Timema douglasi]